MKKTISIILALVMAVTFVPTFAFAEDVVEPAIEEENTIYSVEDYEFGLSQDKFFYNGKVQSPAVICEELVEGVDFVVEYWRDGAVQDPVDPGQYSAVVIGIGAFDGHVELPFEIVETLIALNKASATIYRKGTLQLKATVTNPNGSTTYKSSNTSVATVSSGGKITAKTKGKAVITVRNGFAKQQVTVTVKNPSLSKTKLTLVKKKSYTLKVTGKIGKATFKSSNKKIATVTKAGKIKAKKKGKCTITVKSNGVTLKCKVKVKNPPPVYVYTTRTGERYHCDYYCWGLRNANAIYKTKLSKAKSRGLTKCQVCY